MLVSIGAAQVATGSPAAAQPPGGCSLSKTYNSGTVSCLTIDEARVAIDCAHNGVKYTLYGPWILGNGVSYAVCHTGDVLAVPVPPVQSVRYDA